MWAISIVCLSLQCEPAPEIPTLFATREGCERALRTVYLHWRPAVGAFSFNCVSSVKI